jgi:methionyl-tRNA formyltransferase
VDAGSGRLATVPQIGEATYAAKIAAADRMLDPARPARELHDRVRALSPHIGARLPLDGALHTIWRTVVREHGPPQGALERDGDTLVLGCGPGALAVLELQAPGGRRMPVADWLRGLRGDLPAVTAA